MKEHYKSTRFSSESLKVIEQANEIIKEYQKQGFLLTLRQLFYQFVSRGLLGNLTQNYKRLGSIVNDGRLAGEIDWDAIEDRTRNLQDINTFESPKDIIEAVAQQFKLDLWVDQEYRPEVWIEKEALAGVFERVCSRLRVPYIACRGYMSQSEMYVTAKRFREHIDNGQTPVILHFGDHDPSGIDMSRDIADRLGVFDIALEEDPTPGMGGGGFERLALNMDQVAKHRPPPNPAKLTDSRCTGYITRFGDKSWELDALDPTMLASLVEGAIKTMMDKKRWDAMVAKEKEHRRLMGVVSDDWDNITQGL